MKKRIRYYHVILKPGLAARTKSWPIKNGPEGPILWSSKIKTSVKFRKLFQE